MSNIHLNNYKLFASAKFYFNFLAIPFLIMLPALSEAAVVQSFGVSSPKAGSVVTTNPAAITGSCRNDDEAYQGVEIHGSVVGSYATRCSTTGIFKFDAVEFSGGDGVKNLNFEVSTFDKKTGARANLFTNLGVKLKTGATPTGSIAPSAFPSVLEPDLGCLPFCLENH